MKLAKPVPYIEIDDRGRAWVAGTRSKVSAIAIDHVRNEMSAREIVESYPHLTLAQVHAALSYYYDHQPKIDAEIEVQLFEAESLRSELETPAYLERVEVMKQRFDRLETEQS